MHRWGVPIPNPPFFYIQNKTTFDKYLAGTHVHFRHNLKPYSNPMMQSFLAFCFYTNKRNNLETYQNVLKLRDSATTRNPTSFLTHGLFKDKSAGNYTKPDVMSEWHYSMFGRSYNHVTSIFCWITAGDKINHSSNWTSKSWIR